MSNYKPGDLVLSKTPSYPFWPAVVVNESAITKTVKKAKPKGEKTWCCYYLGDQPSFAWSTAANIKSLATADIEKALKDKAIKKKKDLTKAYQNALEPPVEGDIFQGDNVDDDEEEDVEEDDNEEVQEKPAPKTTKRSKKVVAQSEDEEEEQEVYQVDDDEEDVQDGEDGEVITKKRSRTNNKKAEKKQKTASTSSKKAAKSESTTSKTTKTKTTKTQSLKNSKSAKSTPQGTPQPELSEIDKPKQLYHYRTRLQKGLIQRSDPAPPSTDELKGYYKTLGYLEKFPVTVDLLKSSKIHKVLKAILRVQELGEVNGFDFHAKSTKILEIWSPIVNSLRTEKVSSPARSVDHIEESEVIKKEEENQENGKHESNGSEEKNTNGSEIKEENEEVKEEPKDGLKEEDEEQIEEDS